MADNPDIQWALDALTPDPDYKPSLLTEYGFQVSGAVSLFAGVCYDNKLNKRPLFSGIQRHILGALAGYVAGYYAREFAYDFYAKRDQKIRHYITLHPEDFPKPERKKWSEILDPWYPVR